MTQKAYDKNIHAQAISQGGSLLHVDLFYTDNKFTVDTIGGWITESDIKG